MATVEDKTKEVITLHGLGFLQVQRPGNVRLHIWHPDLPRRQCFKHSAIHNHRFGFLSRVLVGTQINHRISVTEDSGNGNEWPDSLYIGYLHEGPRTQFGNRPWKKDKLLFVQETAVERIEAGHSYTMFPYHFHWTEPGGDGRVATLMQKMEEGKHGAHSLCRASVTPDVDFDRKQWADDLLWEVVADVIGDVSMRRIRDESYNL